VDDWVSRQTESRRRDAVALGGVVLAIVATTWILLLGGELTFVAAAILLGTLLLVRPWINDKIDEYWRTQRGLDAQLAIRDLLRTLDSEGWITEYSMPDPRGGDIDHVAKSPSGRVFVIETKSGSWASPDQIKKVKRQAADVARQRGLRWVTPAMCLVGRREASQKNGVSLLPRHHLLGWLRENG
jgi:hypothetical protein